MKSKKQSLIRLVAVLVLLASTACAHSDGPYRGKVVELETGKPIEGAVVAARWMIEPFVHSERICDAKETVTDKNGEFALPKGSCTSHLLHKCTNHVLWSLSLGTLLSTIRFVTRGKKDSYAFF